MVLRKLMGVFMVALIVGAASLAIAGVPDVTQCSATRTYTGPEKCVLLNVPDGNGNAFTDAVKVGGGVVDATITVIVKDAAGAYIVNFPFEDIWIETVGGTMVACTGGATSDASTDVNGMTEFQTPLQAGGADFTDTVVLINGNAIPGTVLVSYNSPDLDANGSVNLTDVQFFASDYYAVSYAFRSDLFFDNVVNLSDIPVMASSVGAGCP